jgi:uncharacterized membrane protein (UPF0136 family)
MKINYKSPAVYSILALIVIFILFATDSLIQGIIVAFIFGFILCVWNLIYGIRQRKILYIILGVLYSLPVLFVIYTFIQVKYLGGEIHF